jgi:cell volume regulation protein A
LIFSLLQELLLGSIVSSTDAAAVSSILQDKGVGLKGSLRPVLELESGSNDLMTYFTTITLTNILASGDVSFYQIIPIFIKGFSIGGLMGYGMGKLTTWLINNIQLNSDGLYHVLIVGLAMFTYSAKEAIAS